MSWNGTARWECPALCGCALNITATWSAAPDAGVAHKHPIPRTITSISVAATCPTHDALRTTPLPVDPYFGSPGYLALPQDTSTLTEAERLYAHLFRFTGQLARIDTCGCRIYSAHDRGDVNGIQRRPHPRHTIKCAAHQTDNDDHSQARGDNERKNRLLDRVESALGIPRDDIAWSFSVIGASRVLTVVLTGATTTQRTQAQAWADANYPGRIVVEIG